MNKYAHEYVDSKRIKLSKKYPTEDDFINNYSLSEREIADFIAFVYEDSKIEITEEDWKVSGEAIKIRITAFIGRNLYEPSTFYRVIAGLNETLQEAIEILKDGRFEKARLAHRTF